MRINLFGFLWERVKEGDFSRTAWDLKIGPIRFVEWPWGQGGVHVQWYWKEKMSELRNKHR